LAQVRVLKLHFSHGCLPLLPPALLSAMAVHVKNTFLQVDDAEETWFVQGKPHRQTSEPLPRAVTRFCDFSSAGQEPIYEVSAVPSQGLQLAHVKKTVKNTFIEVDDMEDDWCSQDGLVRQQSEAAPKPVRHLSMDNCHTQYTQDTIAETCEEASDHDNAHSNSDETWDGEDFDGGPFPWARVVTGDGFDQHDSNHYVKASADQSIDQEAAYQGSGDDQERGTNEQQPQMQYVQMMVPIPMGHQMPTNCGSDYNGTKVGFTVMVRNVPNKYSRDLFVEELNETGYLGAFDFLYLPIDPETRANKGYAFVNFTNMEWANMFMNAYENRKMMHFGSEKRISVSPAVLQGFQANYAHYSQKYVNQHDPSMRPLFFFDVTSGASQPTPPASTPARVNQHKRLRRIGKASLIDQAARQQALRAAGISTDFSSGQPLQQKALPRPQPSQQQQVVAASPEPHGQAAPTVQFCPFCGANCQAGFKFCQMCGKSLKL